MILTTGEIVIDCFVSPGSDGAIAMDARVAGSGLTVAIALRRQGIEAGMLAAVSSDWLGTQVRETMLRESLIMDYVLTRDLPSTIAFVTPDERGDASYSFIRENPADLSLTFDDLPLRLPPAVEALHFGSYSLHVNPLGSALRALIWREAGRRFISYDLNVRPTVISDMSIWRDHTESLIGYCSLVKASDEDMALAYPEERVDDVVERWLGSGAGLVVMTRGEKGLMAKTRQATVYSEALPVKIVDTVGAGDTVQATLLQGLKALGAFSRGRLNGLSPFDLQRLIDRAARAAAVTCSRQGANPPTSDDLPPL